MKSFFTIATAVLASVASVIADTTDGLVSSTLLITNFPAAVVAGDSYTITWVSDDNTSPVTFLLKAGASTDLKIVDTLTSSATGGSYIWTVDSDLPNGANYAVQIVQGKELNYMGPFPLTGGKAVVSSSSVSASKSASKSASQSASASVSASVTGSVSSSSAVPTGGSNSTVSLTSTVRSSSVSLAPTASTTGNSSISHPPFDGAAVGVSAMSVRGLVGVGALFAAVAVFA